MISFRGLTKSMRGRDGFERYSRPDDAVLIANFAMALTTNFIEKERCAAASSLRNSLRHAGNHMLLLGRGTAMQRVANFLLEMDRRLAHRGMMALPMCRRDIGTISGLHWKQPQGRFRSSTGVTVGTSKAIA